MTAQKKATKSFMKRDVSSREDLGGTPIDVVCTILNQMSREERSDALNDLHGVADEIIETPDYITAKKREMSIALLSLIATMGSEESRAFRNALRMSRDYVDGLKLRFLRCDRFDANMAATRMILFFSRKAELFGEEKLAQDIKLKDLSEEESDALQNGLMQLLPLRDRAGRAILLVDERVNVMYANTKSVVSSRSIETFQNGHFNILIALNVCRCE
jgi:hypothetical protein